MLHKNFSWFILFIAISFLIGPNAFAHQPRYVQDNQLVLIKNPDVSQAFYGELKSWPVYYLIDLKAEQELYLQILAPDLPGIEKDKAVAVEFMPELGDKSVIFAKLEPAAGEWQKFHEEYAGDDYWQGPAVKKLAEPGYYLIKVSSPTNEGKYVLVAGEKEEFPALEMVKALTAIPQLKVKFFDKPLWQSFQGKIGEYLGFGLLALVIIGFLFHRFHKIYK